MNSTTYSDSIYARLSHAENDLKRIRLMHMKWVATGLLIIFAILYCVATALQTRYSILSYVAAFSEAAMVGALADWFAVVALFRHPLGLSFIPHTAIIPKNKDRIADNLGDFVQGEFFSTERIVSSIRTMDPAGKLATWLSTAENTEKIGGITTKAFVYALNALNEQEVRDYLRIAVAGKIKTFDLAGLAGKTLDVLTQDKRHQDLLDQVLKNVSGYFEQPNVKQQFIDIVAKKLPLGLDALKDMAANSLVEKFFDTVSEFLREINDDPKHPMRGEFDEALTNLIQKLKSDPAYRYQIEKFRDQIAGHQELSAYLDSLWQEFHAWIENDVKRRDSQIHAKIVEMTSQFGNTLVHDLDMRTWINEQLIQYAPGVVDTYRPKLGRFISDKMKEWKEHEIVDKLELNIGRDLQFIRFNGTLVGGLVGLMIHVATTLVF